MSPNQISLSCHLVLSGGSFYIDLIPVYVSIRRSLDMLNDS
jgi:hypothetical protein